MKILSKILFSNISILLTSLLGLLCPQAGKKHLKLISFYAKVRGYNTFEDMPRREVVAIKKALGYYKGKSIVKRVVTQNDTEELMTWLSKHRDRKYLITGYINNIYHQSISSEEIVADGRLVELIFDDTTSGSFVIGVMWKDVIWKDIDANLNLIPSSQAPWTKVITNFGPQWLNYGRSSDIINDTIDMLQSVNGISYKNA